MEKLENKTYYFRLSPDGVLEKAWLKTAKRTANGESVRSSGRVEEKDITSKEIKDRLQHELNFWLKGMYRKPAAKPASPPQTKDAK